MPNIPPIYRKIIGWIFAAAILYFLVGQLYKEWSAVASGDWEVGWSKLALSALLLFCAYLALAQAWRLIIAGFKIEVPYSGAFRVMYLAQLGRYIPGKIWQMVGMVSLAKQIGVPSSVSLASFALGQIYFLPAAFLLIPLLLGDTGKFEQFKIAGDLFYLAAALIMAFFLVVFIMPRGLNWLLNKTLKLLKRDPVDYNPAFGNRSAIFILYIFSWILMGLSFKLFVKAVSPEIEISYPFAAGTYIASYVIGYLSFIAPGGLGVREAVMAGILKSLIPFPSATLIALANRFFITVAETLISLAALLTYRFRRKNKPPD